MKTSSQDVSGTKVHHSSQNSFKRFALFVLLLFLAVQGFSQAPPLLWSKNVGATLFAIDTSTNVYANVGGTIIKLNGEGVPIETNSICPRPGIAIRDSSGNYYFSGLLPSHSIAQNTFFDPQDFGGVVLSNMAVYIVKYSSDGTLIWATNLGPTSVVNNGIGVADFVRDDEGGLVVIFNYALGSSSRFQTTAKFDSNGSQVWVSTGGVSTSPSITGVRLTLYASTNFYKLTYNSNPSASLDRLDGSGAITGITGWGNPFWGSSPPPKVILNSAGDLYNVEGNPNVNLTKRGPTGTVLWSVNTGTAQRAVGSDQYDGVHVASDTTNLSRFDYDGNLTWTRSLPAKCESLLLDSSNNRFISMAGGIIGRLGSETLVAPAITNTPIGKKVFTGTNVVLTVGASGTTPLRYFWLKDGSFLASATNANLTLVSPTSTQSGQYLVIVSNLVGSVTSSPPAQVVIKRVGIFNGSQMLTNGIYSYLSPPTLTIQSAFTNGSKFYTLDGSAPTFASIPYTGSFLVGTSATVRALGYSSDFSQSEEADAVNIVLPPTYSLAVTSTVGGNIALSPLGGIYLSNTVVTVTATPTNGWSFLYWLGDASGTNTSVNLTMNASKSVQAVFGTTLSTTVSGNGQVLLYPAGGVYPYGTTVRLTGVPQPGNYFGVWGNAASGSTNPLYFTITSPSPTVSSLFAATPVGQAALTVIITGKGQVDVSPRANAYATNQSVTLTATPDAGEMFLHWNGSASGTLNPLTLSMNQERVVVANFTGPFRLRAEGLLPQGFRFTLVGDPYAVYQIYSSSNLSQWTGIGSLSNSAPETQFTDPSATNSPQKFYKAIQQ